MIFKKDSTYKENGSLDLGAMIEKTKEEMAKASRDSLLKYCHLDTLAMVRIWQKLHEYAK